MLIENRDEKIRGYVKKMVQSRAQCTLVKGHFVSYEHNRKVSAVSLFGIHLYLEILKNGLDGAFLVVRR